ncbi:IclR family transcriptional regulator C-terminal domain-containing protein [Variovorax sp. J22G73]|uniref:IclR family transcriptional regulator n=1 Tax=unclassified Variovorax TaxID=663243 RepID=UPI0025762D3A|nr:MULTISPECIES: IclR family transcriptional regulator C-terminal domain-containing protein [unclassified Variovorax]MDM0005586.1 IclR family transcriptional regulator C-terminal domain-containing protein [Variovorax sp. J22R203]MDM0099613.1 IclR family transcriptional regulator C-terminal domain-containing protein [Variovorax sp. J22G73]
MPEKSMSSLGRMLGVLDLFDDTHLTRTADDISAALEVSLPTGYRYVRLLLEAGLLQRVEDSHYALGPRIILLDHYIRKADPVLREGIPVMRELVAATGFDCVASGLFGMQVLDTHREMGGAPAALAYGRGRPRPLFEGGAPKVLLATFAPAQLRKVFDARHDELVRCGLPAEWSEFRRHYAAIRKAGHYVSIGELEPQLAAVAAPILKADGGAWGAVSLVFDTARLSIVDLDKMVQLITEGASRIGGRLA